MGNTSTATKDKWNKNNYDDIRIRVPKGRKADIEAFACEHGESINGMVTRLIQDAMKFSDEQWGGEPKMRTIAQLRRILSKDGFRLAKRERGKDSWMIIDEKNHILVAGENIGWTIEEVQEWVSKWD